MFLFLLLLSFAMFQGGFVSWFLFYSFLPIFLYHIGFLFYPISNWTVARTLSCRVVSAGDEVNVTVRICRAIPFPLYYCMFEEVFPETFMRIDNRKDKYHYMEEPEKLHVNRQIKKVIFPSFRRKIELSYVISQVPRGEHDLQAIRVQTGDIFGFVKKSHTFMVQDKLIAYPNVRTIQMKGPISSYEQGSIASSTLHLKNTNVATGVREYFPGDKFSWINWKQTARKNTIMTKEFEQEKSTDVMLILDSCYYEGINELAFEAAIEVTISLMETIQKQSAQVGLLSVGADTVQFPLQQDPTKKEWIRQHLTRLTPTGHQHFSVRLQEEMNRIIGGHILIMITTHIDEPLKQIARQLKRRGDKIMLLYIQSSNRLTREERSLLQQLQFDGIDSHVLTEKQLVESPIEVV
jgi:uncharacterized protein (DUF58 family)